MAQAQHYKLKLSKLQFCSLVDEPAQPNAKTLLIKRKGASDDITATARLAKVNDELGLAFFWAFTTTNKDGSDHYDLQGDQVVDFIKAAMEYMTEGQGAVDIMHDGVAGDDRVVFAMPMDPEIGAAYGYVGKQTGLMVAVKPTAENLAKLKSGELNGVSIGGLGERVPVGKAKPSFAVGDHVECLVNHMPGMKGMTGDIAIAREGTPPYYGVKFDDQKAMPGVHKWLAQDEIKAAPADAKTSMPEMKRAPAGVRKEAILTSETDGHAHSISLDDPTRYWCDQLQTSYQNAAGADGGHSHAWVFDAAGAITIADDSGHGHTVTASVSSDVLAVYAAREAKRDAENLAEAAAPIAVDDDPSDGVCAPVTDEESSGKVINVVIAARAPQNKSTHRRPAGDGASHTENIMANEQTDKTLADLTKRLERAERIAKMSGAQKVHFDTLKGDDAEAFLAKSSKERDVEIAEIEKANEVVYTSKSTGRVFRKSDSRDVVEAFKLIDAQAETLAKRDEAIEKADIRKQAAEVLGGMPGDDDTHDLIVRAVRKSGATAEQIEKAFATLKGMRSTSTIGKKTPGFSGGEPTGDDPIAKRVVFDAKLAEFAKTAGKTTVQAFEAFCNTTEGAELYAASRVIQA